MLANEGVLAESGGGLTSSINGRGERDQSKKTRTACILDVSALKRD